MDRPRLLSTSVRDEKVSGLTYHIEGELVPVLTVELNGNSSVFFEHFILLWKHPDVQIGIKSMKGTLKRVVAGAQVFITEATGMGQIAFSRDGAGQIIPLQIPSGQSILVREHQFLAASGNIDYSFSRVKGVTSVLFGGTGFFVDKFQAMQGDGIVWLHGYGNVFEKNLGQGEVIEAEPGAWLYRDTSVTMDVHMAKLASGFLGGTSLILNRFTGPGRVGLQSMYVHMPTAE